MGKFRLPAIVCTAAWATGVALAQDADMHALPEVTVSNTNAQALVAPGALRDEVTKTESISAKEIQNSGATNLPQLLTGRPGIDVQVECSVCNTRNITLNNLPGRFTTLLVDGVPSSPAPVDTTERPTSSEITARCGDRPL